MTKQSSAPLTARQVFIKALLDASKETESERKYIQRKLKELDAKYPKMKLMIDPSDINGFTYRGWSKKSVRSYLLLILFWNRTRVEIILKSGIRYAGETFIKRYPTKDSPVLELTNGNNQKTELIDFNEIAALKIKETVLCPIKLAETKLRLHITGDSRKVFSIH